MAAAQEAVTAEERQAPRAGAQALGLLGRNDNQTLRTETTRVSEDTSSVRGQQFFSEVSHLKDKPWLFGPAWPQMHVLDWDHNHGNWNLPYFHQPFKKQKPAWPWLQKLQPEEETVTRLPCTQLSWLQNQNVPEIQGLFCSQTPALNQISKQFKEKMNCCFKCTSWRWNSKLIDSKNYHFFFQVIFKKVEKQSTTTAMMKPNRTVAMFTITWGEDPWPFTFIVLYWQ